MSKKHTAISLESKTDGIAEDIKVHQGGNGRNEETQDYPRRPKSATKENHVIRRECDGYG